MSGGLNGITEACCVVGGEGVWNGVTGSQQSNTFKKHCTAVSDTKPDCHIDLKRLNMGQIIGRF